MDGVEKINSPMSASAQLRKIKKPLIEKRRRERINECLVQLKALVLEAMNKDNLDIIVDRIEKKMEIIDSVQQEQIFQLQGSQYSKMEKADILEMTVAHLKSICGVAPTLHQTADSADDKNVDASINHISPISSSSVSAVHRYVSGYTECAVEVANFLSVSTGNVEPTMTVINADTVRRSLLQHLDTCLHRQTNRLAPILSEELLSTGIAERLTDKSWSQCAVSEHCEVSPMSEGWQADRLTEFVTRSASSSPIEDSVTSFTSMTRLRCDSGVYSGASSPIGSAGDEMTTIACWHAAGDWTSSKCGACPSVAPSRCIEHHHNHQSYYPKIEIVEDQICQLHQDHQVLNLTKRPSVADSDVWRPW